MIGIKNKYFNMEWFIVGFFLYLIIQTISNWVSINKEIKESNDKLSDKVLWSIILDVLTIIVLTICIRRICLTLIALNIL